MKTRWQVQGWWPLAALALACAAPSVARAQATQPAPLRAADYARPPMVHQVVVSPSNAHAAMRVTAPNGRTALAVVDLADPSQRRVVAGYDDVDIVDVRWVNDRRLVYEARQPEALIEYDKWGAIAIDLDGGSEQHLISARSDTEAPTGSGIRSRALPRGWDIVRPVGDGSDDVLVTRWLDTAHHGFRPRVLARVDTRSLRLTVLSDGQPEGTDGWLLDAQGQVRVATSTVRGRSALWWKPRADAAWERLHEWDVVGGAGMDPRALESDGTLIVATRRSDTVSLHAYDPTRRHLDPEPLVSVKGVDLWVPRFDRRQQRVSGVHVPAARPVWVWFDEGLARAQAAVDRALPAGRSNTLLCGDCIGAERFVVHSRSDRHPGEYLLYDARTRRLLPLAAQRPWLSEATQGRRTLHEVAARDGLALPVVVTHPPSLPPGQPAPTVVLVHGGPFAPGADLSWSAEPQFLAASGYRVLEVSFRGTTGLGWKHFRSGWGQWGRAMQDDLEDALLWAVKERLADPQRVCIYGASYGGYAALMGPVRHPGRYRCAASHVGVTDISLLFSGNWTDISLHGRTYSLPAMVGDPERDRDRLREVSPLYRVADIRVPVLVAQGRLDRRVAPVHADRFVAAARSAGVAVERVDYEEGHGFVRPEAQADFWERLDAFLARHLRQP